MIILTFFLIISTLSVEAGFLDWFKGLSSITGMGATGSVAPSIDVGNTAPIVENITFMGDPSVTLSESVPTPIIISFLAMDMDGADDFDNSTAYLNVTLGGADMRSNSSICYPETIGSNATAQNYTCTIVMEHWDLNGDWTCAAEISDGTDYGGKEVENCFSVGSTTAINISTSSLAWATLKVSDTDKMMSTDELNITNTGNQNLTSITLEAINLIGETTGTIWIPAANFTATWGERTCSTGIALVNDTATTITGSKLDFGPGSLETTNNATHICLEEVGQDITQQTYSTAGNIEDWTITGVA